MIHTEIKTFKEWNWPFIACDYAGVPADDKTGETAKEYEDCLLAGAVVDYTTSDTELNTFLIKTIEAGACAIMVDYHLMEDDTLLEKLKNRCDTIFITRLGLMDSQSYDLRLSYIPKIRQ